MHALNHIRKEGGHVLADGHCRYDCDRMSPSFSSKWPFRANLPFFTACFCTSKSVRRSSSRHSAISPRKEQKSAFGFFYDRASTFSLRLKEACVSCGHEAKFNDGRWLPYLEKQISDETDRKLSSKLFFSAFSYLEYTSSTVPIWYIHLSVYVYVRI